MQRKFIYQAVANVIPPVAAALTVVTAMSPDIVVTRNVIYQTNAWVPGPPPPPPPTIASYSASDVVTPQTVLSQGNGFVAAPAAAIVPSTLATSSSSIVVAQRTVLNQTVAAVPTPPFAPITAMGGVSTEIIVRSWVINQTVAAAPTLPSAPPITSIFAPSPERQIRARSIPFDGFVFAPPAQTWSFTGDQPRLVTVRLKIGQDGFIGAPFVTVTALFSPSDLIRRLPRQLLQDGFVSSVTAAAATPSVFGFSDSPAAIIKPKSQPSDPFISQAAAVIVTPSALAFSEPQFARIKPRPVEYPTAAPLFPSVTPWGWASDQLFARQLSHPPQFADGFVSLQVTFTPSALSFSEPPWTLIKPKAREYPAWAPFFPPTGAVTPSSFGFSEHPISVTRPRAREYPAFAPAVPPVVIPPTLASYVTSVVVVPRVVLNQITGFVPPSPAAIPATLAAYIVSDVTIPQLVLNQANGFVAVPTVAVTTPSSFSFVDQVTTHLGTTVLLMEIPFALIPPVATPSSLAFSGWPFPAYYRSVDERQPPLGFFLPPGAVTTPSNFAFSEQSSGHQVVSVMLTDVPFGLIVPTVTPGPLVFSGWPFPAYYRVVEEHQPPLGFFLPPGAAVTPSAFQFSEPVTEHQIVSVMLTDVPFAFIPPAPTSTTFPWSAQPEVIIRPKALEYPTNAPTLPPGVTITATFYSWSASPELIKKPTPLLAPDVAFRLPPTPINIWAWSASPERIIRPRPLLTPSADISFQLVTLAPSFYPWSPSPELLIRPKPREYPSYTPQAFPPFSFYPWSASPELIIRPRPLLTPAADFQFVPPAATAAFYPWSPSPERIIRPHPLLTPDVLYALAFRIPLVTTPSLWPWSQSPDPRLKYWFNVALLPQPFVFLPPLPPPVVVVRPVSQVGTGGTGYGSRTVGMRTGRMHLPMNLGREEMMRLIVSLPLEEQAAMMQELDDEEVAWLLANLGDI